MENVLMKHMRKSTAARLLAILLSAAVLLCGCREIEVEAPATTDSINATLPVITPLPEARNDAPALTSMTTDISTEYSLSQESAADTTTTEETSSAVQVTTEAAVSSAEAETTAATETELSVTTAEATTTAPVTTTEQTTVTEAVTTAAPETTTTEAVTTTEATTTTVLTTAPATTLANAAVNNSRGYSPLNYSTQKAVWISYLDYAVLMEGKSQAEFTSVIGGAFDNIAAMGCNTVYIHASAWGDAYYPSAYYPWGENASGTIGVSPGYDPFGIMVSQAHARGLSVHAWINPMRGMYDSKLKGISDSYILKQWYNDSAKRGQYIVKVGDIWYLNPAYGEPVQLICSRITEIMSAYQVDGIHIDDYFYPESATASFDSVAYKASGTSMKLGDWRRSLVSGMVRQMYKTVKSCNPSALFGISPQGNIENNYNYMYFDAASLCAQDGYMDYIVPQIYFGYNSKAKPFSRTLADWRALVTNGNIKLVIGLANYKVGRSEYDSEWSNGSDIITRQTTESLSAGCGVAYFKYIDIVYPPASAAAKVNADNDGIKKALGR